MLLWEKGMWMCSTEGCGFFNTDLRRKCRNCGKERRVASILDVLDAHDVKGRS